MVKKRKIVRFNNFGHVLATRKLGRQIREEIIVANFKESTVVIFDFRNVELLTHSFADECIGKILLDLDMVRFKKLTRFINYNSKIEFQIISSINQNIEIKMNTVQNM